MRRNSAPPLSKLQSALKGVLTHPEGVSRGLRRDGNGYPVLSWVIGNARLSVRERLAVYSDAYFQRLLDSMGYDFRAVKRALGEEDFRRLAADYLKDNPSQFKSIALVGERLPAFIRRHPFNQKFGFLADLARLEWEALCCLYSDRLPPLDLDAVRFISQEAWPSVRLVLDTTVRLSEFEWAVDRLWNQRELPESKGFKRLRKKGARRLLVFRDESWVQVRALDLAEWSALLMIRRSAALEELCRFLGDSPRLKAGAGAVRKWFENWVRAGLVKGVVL